MKSRLIAGLTLSPRRAVPGGEAFTLIELMVVVALVGIAGVLLVPEMKGSYHNALLRAACRELVDTFQLAYSRAVSLNQDHRVRIDGGSGRYVIEVAQGGSISRPEFHPLKGVTGCEGKLDKRIRVMLRRPAESPEEQDVPSSPEEVAGNDGPVFFADGTATACEILLRDQFGFALSMAVNPVTGRARIGELHRE